MSKFRLDEVDHQILDMLIDNTRVPFTDIAKKLLISAGTVHVRVKKMEDAGIIMGSSLVLDYDKLGYSFIAYVGVFLNNTSQTKFVLERINEIPFVTVASVTTGKFNIFCKISAAFHPDIRHTASPGSNKTMYGCPPRPSEFCNWRMIKNLLPSF